MSTINVYSFEDNEGNEDGFTTEDYQEAVQYAAARKLLILDNEYEWQDASPVASFRDAPAEPVFGLEDHFRKD